VTAQPHCKALVQHVAGGDGEHGEHTRRIVGTQHFPIDAQKDFSRNEACALVAVDEPVVARDAKT
jgi:hypothetical protein